MELHQLRYFLAVVDEGTFTAAAAAVNVSQSGVSTQLRKLENELGVTLMERSTRRVVLTPAGRQLVPRARAVLAAVDEVAATAAGIRGLVTGSLRIGTVTGLVWPPLFDGLGAIHAAHPGIELHLHEGTSEDLIAEVRDGATDVAVAAWSDREPDHIEFVSVFDDALVAVVADDHPWAARVRIRPAELAHAELIALPEGTGARAALDALLARVGSAAVPRWEVSSPAYVQMLASRGIGVGVVSETTAHRWTGVTALPIADRRARSGLGVAWRRRPGDAARALLREILPPEADSP
ncbi:MAG: LysR family transcriptional regulator [Microbacterium sp.]|uniref:LysR family transcriptional regulator n=1 Tax=Microbacterium sp. TaxID=51671 RepID=UPI0039E50AA6